MAVDPRHQVDLRRMRTVVEVERARGITSAAETLGLTQSAVSRTVAELEAALGQRLFERLPRGIEPTEAGRLFIARAKRVLADVDDLIADVGNSGNAVTGRLRIGVNAACSHITPTIAAFVAAHPLVALETVHDSDQTLAPKLMQGDLDLVLGSSRYLKRWHDVTMNQLAPLHFACMVRRDHPVLSLDEVREEDLLQYPIIMPEIVEPAYTDIALRYAHHGLPPMRPHYVTNNPELMASLLRASDAFLPVLHSRPDFGGLGRAFALLRNVVQIPDHSVCLARASHRPRLPIIEAFERVMLEALSEQRDTFAA